MKLTKQEESELRQAQEILNRVLPKLKSEPKESELIAFPEGYVIKKGTEVVALAASVANMHLIVTNSSNMPWCKLECREHAMTICSHYLAPLHPEDHPNHPQFKLSAGDYVKITEKGRGEGVIVKLTCSDIENLPNGKFFRVKGYAYHFPTEARFCTDAEIQEFEESLKPKPIPHGTLCLVGDDLKRQNLLALYSDGKGEFYIDGKSGGSEEFTHAIPFTPEMQQIVEDYIKTNQ